MFHVGICDENNGVVALEGYECSFLSPIENVFIKKCMYYMHIIYDLCVCRKVNILIWRATKQENRSDVLQYGILTHDNLPAVNQKYVVFVSHDGDKLVHYSARLKDVEWMHGCDR